MLRDRCIPPFSKIWIIVDPMYSHGPFTPKHLWAPKSCIAINFAIICSNLNKFVLVDQREIRRKWVIHQREVILWCLGVGSLAVMVMDASVFGNIEVRGLRAIYGPWHSVLFKIPRARVL